MKAAPGKQSMAMAMAVALNMIIAIIQFLIGGAPRWVVAPAPLNRMPARYVNIRATSIAAAVAINLDVVRDINRFRDIDRSRDRDRDNEFDRDVDRNCERVRAIALMHAH